MGLYTEFLKAAADVSHQAVTDVYVNRPADNIAGRVPLNRAKELARDYYEHLKSRRMDEWFHWLPVTWEREGVYDMRIKDPQPPTNLERREFLHGFNVGSRGKLEGVVPTSYDEVLRRYNRGLLRRQQRALTYAMDAFGKPQPWYADMNGLDDNDVPNLPKMTRPDGYHWVEDPVFNAGADAAVAIEPTVKAVLGTTRSAMGVKHPVSIDDIDKTKSNANTAFWNSGVGKAVGNGLDLIYGKRPPEVK